MQKEKKITVTNYKDRADYKRKYNQAYREQFGDYFKEYRKANKERLEINLQKHYLKKSQALENIALKKGIKELEVLKKKIQELETELKLLKQKYKTCNEAINETLKKQIANESK